MKIPFFNFTKGENSNISPFLIDPAQLWNQNGVNSSYRVGELLKDPGFSNVGLQLVSGKSVLGLHNFRQSLEPLVEKELATIDNSTSTATKLFYKTDAGAWTEIPAAAAAWTLAGVKVRMASFLGYCFMVGFNGSSFITSASLTGTTFSTATQVTNMPQAKYIFAYKSQLYLLNVKYGGVQYPYRVVNSGVPSAGSITWNPSTNYFDVGDLSEEIVGGAVNFNRLLIFTQENTYIYDGSSLDNPAFHIGAQNSDVIASHGSYVIFANTDGVWITTGGQPQNISGEMQDFIFNSDPSVWKASPVVDEEWHLFLGDVSVNGIEYTNLTIVWSFKTSSWRKREYSLPITIFGKYNSPSTGKRLYFGDANGHVWNKSKYSDEIVIPADEWTGAGTGKPISTFVEFAPFILNDYSSVNHTENIVAYALRAQGVTMKARVIDRNQRVLTDYKPVGQLKNFMNIFQVEMKQGTLVQFALSENSKLPYFSFYGFELDVDKAGAALKSKN